MTLPLLHGPSIALRWTACSILAISATALAAPPSSATSPGAAGSAPSSGGVRQTPGAASEIDLTHYRAGLGFLERGEHAMAVDELNAFIDAATSTTPATKGDAPVSSELTAARYARAICLVELKRPNDAAADLDAVLSVRPFDYRADALLLRARIAFDQGDFARAAECAGAIATESPDFAHRDVAGQIAGESLLRSGHPDSALTTLDAVLARHPEPAVARRSALFAGYAAIAMKDDTGAIARLGNAPRDGAAADELAAIDLLAAQCHHRLGDLPRAYDRYRSASAASPSEASLLGVGQTGRAAGHAPEAAAALDQLLRRSPAPDETTLLTAAIERARISLAENHPAEARTLLESIEPSTASSATTTPSASEPVRSGKIPSAPRGDAKGSKQGRAGGVSNPSTANGSRSGSPSGSRTRGGDHGGATTGEHGNGPSGRSGAAATPTGDASVTAASDDLRGRFLSWRANAQAACGAFAEAASTLATAIESLAPSALRQAMRFDRAGYLLSAKDFGAAVEEYDRFLSEAPSHELVPQASVRRALCLARLAARDDGEGSGDGSAPTDDQLARIAAARTALAAALTACPAEATADRELVLTESLDLATRSLDWPAVETLANDLLTVSADPQRRAESLLRRGIAASRQDRPAEAIEHFDRMLALDAPPASALARLERAEALLRVGRTEEAIGDLRAVIEATTLADGGSDAAPGADHRTGRRPRTPGQADAPGHAGRMTATAAQQSAARARLVNVLLRSGQVEDVQHLLADSAESAAAGDLAVDLAVAQSMSGRFADAVSTLSRFLASGDSPRRPEALARRGLALARLGRHDDSLADLHQAMLLPLPAELASAVAFERAMALVAGDRSAPSFAEGTKALEDLGSKPGLYRPFALIELARLGLEAFDRGDAAPTLLDRVHERIEACRSHLDDVSERDRPGLEDRLSYLGGVVASRRRDHAAAVKEFEAFLARSPSNPLAPSVHLLIGESQLALGRGRDAAASFQAAIDLGLPDATLEPTLLRLGEACDTAQDWTASDAAYARFLERFPSSAYRHQALFGRGWAAEQAGQRETAMNRYRDLVAHHDGPTAARAQFQIGECLFALGRHDDAVREYMKVDVLFAYPEWSAAALYEAGRSMVALERPDQARKLFEDVRRRFAATRWAELAARDAAALAPRTPDALPGHASGA